MLHSGPRPLWCPREAAAWQPLLQQPLECLPLHGGTHLRTPSLPRQQRGAQLSRGAVRCGLRRTGGSYSVPVGATRLPVVTGGPAPPVPRAEAPRNDGFATRNAAATSRHGAYWRPPVVGTVLSGE